MADYQYQVSTGVIVPDTATTLSEVINEFRGVFGHDLVVDPSSPQGMLIARIAEMRDAVARNNAQVANQINPMLSSGVFLDALVSFSGAYRFPASKAKVDLTCTGTIGTLIPKGSIATTQSGTRFISTQDMTISGSGSVVIPFESELEGNIGADAHTINTIGSSISGWVSVDNQSDAIRGRDTESDTALRRRRNRVLATQSIYYTESITSRIMGLVGVKSALVLENPKGTTEVVDGVSLEPHSLWVNVDGGLGSEIVNALYRSKTPGTVWSETGTVSHSIIDPITNIPYTVFFRRPTEILLLVRVTLGNPLSDAANIIPQYVLNYIDGLTPGDQSYTIGTDISPFEIAAAINYQDPAISIRKVELSLLGSGTWSSNTYTIPATSVARTLRGSISVVLS